jgi:hypothetical protein
VNLGRLVFSEMTYLCAEQVAQWAQSVLPSIQHLWPQDGADAGQLADLWQQLEAQPETNSAVAQTSRADSLMSFMFFLWVGGSGEL